MKRIGSRPGCTSANENVRVIIIIEQKHAIESKRSRLSRVSMCFGVSDLSFSLGVGGKQTDPIVEEAVSKVLAAGQKHHLPVGYPTGNPAEIHRRIA